MEEYTFSSGLMHFRRMPGKPGFIWKFLAAYTVAFLILFVMMGVISGLVVPTFTSDFLTTGAADTTDPVMILVVLGFLLLGALIMAVFEAAALRRYIHAADFRLRFGMEEVRLLGVYVIWFVMLSLSYVLLGLVVGLISFLFMMGGGAAGGAFTSLSVIAVFLSFSALPLIMLAIVTKASSASAMTIRDGKFTFFPAAHVTIGRFWKVYFAYILVYLGLFLVMVVVQLLMTLAMVSTGTGASASGAPAVTAGIIAMFMMLVLPALTGFGQLVTLGMTSKLVLTDPEWKGRADQLAETFN